DYTLPEGRAEAINFIQNRITEIKKKAHRLSTVRKHMQEAISKLEEGATNLGEEERTAEEKNISNQINMATDIVIEVEETLDELADKEIELQQQLEERRTLREEIHNIHDQAIPAVVKFNYLLEALTGEIRETIGRFQITERGYTEAIEWLKKRYGKDDIIIEQLYARLEKIQSKGRTTKAQRQLFEEIATTVTQLRNKGQDVSHRQLLTQITRKFEESIQEKIITKKAEMTQSNSWTWDNLSNVIEDTLSRRELVEEMREFTQGGRGEENSSQWLKKTSNKVFDTTCLYCRRTNHPASECREVPPNERIAFFRRNNMCLNCGRKNHMIAECKSPHCRKCGRKHHSSLCGIKIEMPTTQASMESRQQSQATQPAVARGTAGQQRNQRGQRQENITAHSSQHSARQNCVAAEAKEEEHTQYSEPQEEQEKEVEESNQPYKEIPQTKQSQGDSKTTHLLSGVKITRNLPSTRTETMLERIPELREMKEEGEINGEEMKKAKQLVIKGHQRHYREELEKENMRNLNIQEDKEGVWRCNGRLGKSLLSEEQKKPEMTANEEAREFMERLYRNSRRALTERDLQNTLEADYFLLGKILKDCEAVTQEFKTLRSTLIENEECDKKFFVEACAWTRQTTELVCAMSYLKRDARILWDVYELLIESGFASPQSRRNFEHKARPPDHRPISLDTTIAIIDSEAMHLTQLANEFRNTIGKEFKCFIQQPERSEEEKKNLDDLRNTMEEAMETMERRTHDIKEDVSNKFEEMKKDLHDSLGKIKEAIETKMEVITEAQIQQLVKLQALEKNERTRTDTLRTAESDSESAST
ncbi:zinc knuckle, partial [Ostertagia ostertagi]